MNELSSRAQAVINHTVNEQLPLIMDLLTQFREEDWDGSISMREVAEHVLKYAFTAYEKGTAGFTRNESES